MTTAALAWTGNLLSQHERCARGWKAEIDAVLGPDGAPELEDTSRLPYTTAVFSEAMRLYPPFGWWAVAPSTTSCSDVEVPARTIVLAANT